MTTYHQLSVDGAISLSNVALNIRTINCLIEEADLPVEFVDGFIQVGSAAPTQALPPTMF